MRVEQLHRRRLTSRRRLTFTLARWKWRFASVMGLRLGGIRTGIRKAERHTPEAERLGADLPSEIVAGVRRLRSLTDRRRRVWFASGLEESR